MKTDSPSIILITIDCLRFDHLGCYGYHIATSPNIDRLAAKGAIFWQAISNGGTTANSFPSILASALPPLDMTEHREMMKRSTTLAEVLKGAGYHTAAFHSNPHLVSAYYYARGFDIFEDYLGGTSSTVLNREFILEKKLAPLVAKYGKTVWNFLAKIWRLHRIPFLIMGGKPAVEADELTDLAISSLRTQNVPLFLWLHYMDVHPPYMPPAKYLNQFCDHSVSRRKMVTIFSKMLDKPDEISPSERDMLINLYDASIRYVDDAVGRLLDSLGDELENTIVVVTADHGDEFGEHGKFSHFTLYDGLLHVPLIIAGRGIKAGIVANQQVSLIDLAPTITTLAGIEKVPGFAGASLLPTMNGGEKKIKGTISTLAHPRGTMISYRIPDWKYIRTGSHDGGILEEVYDLTGDPGETKNLHGTDNSEAGDFEAEAVKKLAEFRQLKTKQFTDQEKLRIKAKLGKISKL